MINEFYKLSIKRVYKGQKNNFLSITLNIPNNLLKKYKYEAGQYLLIGDFINEVLVHRSYSLYSAPYEKDYSILIKLVKNGVFSSHALSVFKSGYMLKVGIPQGKFIYKPNFINSCMIVLFGVGSGITPLYSIIKTILHEEKKSKIILFYGNKTLNDAIFKIELDILQQKYCNRFRVYYILSRQYTNNHLLSGRLDKSKVSNIFNFYLQNLNVDLYYICGPNKMIYEVCDVLKKNGVHQSIIKYELFEPITTKQKHCSTKNCTILELIHPSKCTTIKTNNSVKSILDHALYIGVDVVFSCKQGMCGLCIAKLLDGKVDMRQNYALTDQEISEGFILTCQSYIKDKYIKIKWEY